jgi:septal ring factor EnvC (AmiA/AmiB activator)
MGIPRQSIVIWAVMVIAWNPVARAADPPQPTPTPRPGTLAALAKSTSLTRDGTTSIFITDDNLAELSGGAVVTMLTTTASEPTEITTSAAIDPKRRSQWRNKVLAQGKRIANLQRKRASVKATINSLERGRLNSRALDNIAKAKADLQAIDSQIRDEKSQLSRIVREARKEGAQPGWFR